MTRFVTGGAGFIGANYLFYLRAHYPDDRLVCIDKLTYAGNLSTLAPLLGQPNFRFARWTSATARRFTVCLRTSAPTWL